MTPASVTEVTVLQLRLALLKLRAPYPSLLAAARPLAPRPQRCQWLWQSAASGTGRLSFKFNLKLSCTASGSEWHSGCQWHQLQVPVGGGATPE